jgi:Virulence factor
VTTLITVYWRDIPAQVIGRQGRKSVFKKVLHPRFQRAIDRAAMRAGRGSSEHYLADWRRESRPCDGDLEQAVNDEVSRLESGFPPDVLDKVVRAGGMRSGSDASS